MNERFEFRNLSEPELFDRLVDGELSPTEEQALVSELDTRPDGWRRCALAFLEARAWKDEFEILAAGRCRVINGTPDKLPLHKPVNIVEQRAATAPDGQRAHALVVAASVAIAFLLGIAAHWQWNRGGGARNHVAQDTGESSPRQDQITRHPGQPASTITMTLLNGGGAIDRQIEIPVVEANGLDPRWLQTRPSAIPEKVIETLRRSGHTVEEQRLYVPVVLEDGRRAIVALDQAEVKYEGMRF